MKLLNMIVAGALIASAGVVSASDSEPLALTEAQMDNVTAAGTATATALADAFGFVAAATLTQAATAVQVLQIIPTQGGQITVDLTTSASHSEAAAL